MNVAGVDRLSIDEPRAEDEGEESFVSAPPASAGWGVGACSRISCWRPAQVSSCSDLGTLGVAPGPRRPLRSRLQVVRLADVRG